MNISPRRSVTKMSDEVKLIECPRDAWQGLKGQIPADLKTNYLRALISAGFKHIDAVSFVSPNAVPQMADSEEVLKELDPPDDVEIIGIVVNEKGAQRAIATEAVRTLGFPYSISPTFLENNQHQTLEDAIEELEKIEKKALYFYPYGGARHARHEAYREAWSLMAPQTSDVSFLSGSLENGRAWPGYLNPRFL